MLTISDPVRGFTLEGIDAHMSIGTLLTPSEFQAEAVRTKQRPMFDTWALFAHLPDRDVKLLESPLIPKGSSVDLATSGKNVTYPVVTLQAAGLQVRFVLCLADRSTQQWLRSVCARGLVTVALEVLETNQLAVVSVPCLVKTAQEVEDIIERCALLGGHEAEADKARTVRQLGQRRSMPSTVPGIQACDLRLICALGPHTAEAARAEKPAARVLN